MFKQIMRPQTALALLALAGVPLFSADSARAQDAWCANYSDHSTNCGFATFAQCEYDVRGIGGMCSQNPAE